MRKDKVKDDKSTLVGLNTTEIGNLTRKMVKASKFLKTEITIKDAGKMIKCTAKVNSNIPTVKLTRVTLIKIRGVDSENLF